MIDVRGTGAAIGSRVNDCSGRSTIDSWTGRTTSTGNSRRARRATGTVEIRPAHGFSRILARVFAENARKTDCSRIFLSRKSVFYRRIRGSVTGIRVARGPRSVGNGVANAVVRARGPSPECRGVAVAQKKRHSDNVTMRIRQ